MKAACKATKNKSIYSRPMMAGGRAVRGRAMEGKDRGVLENITSGQSGDCLIYSIGFIYMWVCAQTIVCAPCITNVLSKLSNGINPSEGARTSYS